MNMSMSGVELFRLFSDIKNHKPIPEWIEFEVEKILERAQEEATAPLLARIAELEKQVEAARVEGYPQGVREYNPVPPKVVHTVRARLKPVGRGKPLDQ
jgi:hypothetical protein